MSSSQKTAVLSQGLLETQLASFYLLSQYFEANSRPMGILRTKGPNDLQGLNPAVSGAHPADVGFFFSYTAAIVSSGCAPLASAE